MKHKILLVLFLSFMTCFTVSAQKVTMQFRQVKLAKVFDAITQQTGLTVAYSRPTVNPDRIVTIEAKDEELSNVLSKLFTGTNVAFEIGEKKIYLKEKAALDATQPNGKIRKISGVIVDEKGESVIGASVAVQGTTLGTITNVDGEYTLADVPESAEITISFIGYKTLVFKANDKALSRITLKEDSEILDEVVVIGYGSMNKRDVTTSIARVGGEELKDMPVTGFDQALVGKMAGVQITQTTGKPNGGTTIRVRGTGSITAGADPLYVVDGVPLERASSALETVDMNDVESIEILKDASSAAIYGSRGSNGVVMITTKKGASGKASVNYNGSVGFQSLSKKIDMLDAYEFAAFARDGHNGSYLTSYPNASPDDPNDVREKSYDKIPPELFPYLEGKPGLVNTDWQDALYRTAPITKHSITVSGGNDKTKFFISGNYLNQKGIIVNLLFVTGCIAIILALLWLLVIYYERILRWCLNNRWKFMLLPIATILCGILIWKRIGQEFMPSLNEGSFLLMPTSMPHTGIEQNLNYIEALDKRLAAIPEVETAIGKWGRVNSALDPAPAQMFENTINYRPEYILNEDGKRERFKVNRKGEYLLRNGGTYNPADGFRLIPADSLIPDRKGDYFRQWRPEIKNTDDIWQQIVNVTHLPGLTSAPKLQPIEARLVMLSTGMRAPMGLKIYGPDLETIEQSGKAIEQALKDVPSVIPSSVFYDRAVGAPYLEIKLNRDNMARYGVNVEDLQEILSAAVGGMILTKTVEGRERFPVRLRYARELRDNPEALSMLLVPTATGAQIPLKELADIEYARGAQIDPE